VGARPHLGVCGSTPEYKGSGNPRESHQPSSKKKVSDEGCRVVKRRRETRGTHIEPSCNSFWRRDAGLIQKLWMKR